MKKTKENIFFGIIIAVAIIGINVLTVVMAKDTADYRNGKDNSVELEATVTSSRKFTEVDEGRERDYWHAYVSYEYNGESYSGVFYQSENKAPTLGKVVTVRINSEKPGELMPTGFEYVSSLIVTPVFLSIVANALFTVIKWGVNSLMKSGQKEGVLSELLSGLFVICVFTIESVIFRNKYGSNVYALFSFIAVCSIVAFEYYKKMHGSSKQQE